jgi:hypothetical protein
MSWKAHFDSIDALKRSSTSNLGGDEHFIALMKTPWGLGMLAGAPRSSERRRQAGQVITIPELVSSWSMR